ncbi:hypothetical protein [Vibrio sp. dhg]|uniref:hypothetical protein n=1 Tax=Vibrio sp. dhg TaxID=2163016 RepID=UPI000E4D52C5|nr:hypothetical protein [Vibrio sp. dhg]AXT70977.1 hypothetical protein DBX26_07970 [Vibrio sp. dhg]
MKSNKLGHVMSFSRMFSFIAFLTVTLAWILSMYALFTVSAAALVISVILYLKDKFLHPKRHTKGKSA